MTSDNETGGSTSHQFPPPSPSDMVPPRRLDADIAAWLRDEVLPLMNYNGPKPELRIALERDDRAYEQLSTFVADQQLPASESPQ